MKSGFIVTVMVLVFASSAAGQGFDDQTRTQLHRGNVKIWIGTALVVTGALIVPATAANGDPNTTEMTVGLVTIGTGTLLVWSGFQQRRRAVRPYTGFGLVLGRQKSIVVRRSW